MGNDYSQINYRKCPHFTVGRVDQWGERGYLFYEGLVYGYESDRKEQYDRVYSPMTKSEFLAYAESENISVPESFAKYLK
jgi:hypothetical protein